MKTYKQLRTELERELRKRYLDTVDRIRIEQRLYYIRVEGLWNSSKPVPKEPQ